MSIAAQLDAYLENLVAHNDLSGSVAVLSRGRILLAKGYGFADREAQVRNTTSTRFQLRSLVRQLNVVGLLRLQEQRKLRISDSACRYLEPCPRSPGTTIRELMDSEIHDADSESVVARLISRAAGESWLQYLRSDLFPRHGLTSLGTDADERPGTRDARPYVLAANGSLRLALRTAPLSAVETLRMSVTDFARFLNGTEGLLLSPQSRRLFFPLPGTEGWNCCWYATRTPYDRAFFHGAHGPAPDGWYALVSYHPASRLTIVIFSNSDSAPIAEIEDDLARIVLGRPHLEVPPAPSGRKLSARLLDRHAGDYSGPGFEPIAVRRFGHRLVASPSWLAVSGGGGERLIAVSKNEFVFSRRPDVRATFENSTGVSRLVLRFTGFRRNPSWRAVYTLTRQD